MARAVYPRDLYARLKALPGFDARQLSVDWTLERKAIQGLDVEELVSWVDFHIVREQPNASVNGE
jgi:hypothetical protein